MKTGCTQLLAETPPQLMFPSWLSHISHKHQAGLEANILQQPWAGLKWGPEHGRRGGGQVRLVRAIRAEQCPQGADKARFQSQTSVIDCFTS